ncbi:regulator [Vibrio cyclitrophicus]
MKYREMSKNYIFRELECQMTKEEVAELCFKTVRTVTGWDEGKPIPPECKRLMRMAKGRELSPTSDWKQFKIHYDKLELPTGNLVTAQQVLLGIALLEIQSELELETTSRLLRYARCLSKMLVERGGY